MTKLTNKPEEWEQWLAGLIDGDGYFYIDTKKTARFEITVGLADEMMLQQIKNKYPGSLKLRSGAKAVRLRISQQDVLKQLLVAINGKLQYPKRITQFISLCDHFGIQVKNSEPIGLNHGYLSGLLDSDGTICISVSKTTQKLSQLAGEFGKIQRLQESRGYNQLKISITSKDQAFLVMCLNQYNIGKVLTQKANSKNRHPNQLYRWEFTKQDLPILLDYWKKFPLRSIKRKRAFLIPHYLDLKKQKSHLAQGLQKKAWDRFCQKWYS